MHVPIYDAAHDRHRELVDLATRAEEVAAALDVSGVNTFQAQRRLIRETLDQTGVAQEIDALVLSLVEPATTTSAA